MKIKSCEQMRLNFLIHIYVNILCISTHELLQYPMHVVLGKMIKNVYNTKIQGLQGTSLFMFTLGSMTHATLVYIIYTKH
jgi:hypothetical protein